MNTYVLQVQRHKLILSYLILVIITASGHYVMVSVSTYLCVVLYIQHRNDSVMYGVLLVQVLSTTDCIVHKK